MNQSMSRAWLGRIWALAGVVLLSGALPGWCEDGPEEARTNNPPQPQAPLVVLPSGGEVSQRVDTTRLRRVFVAPEALAELATDHVPMRAEDFFRAEQHMLGSSEPRNRVFSVWQKGVYHGRYSEDLEFVGEAQLSSSSLSEAASDKTTPWVIPLGNCRLSLRDPRWLSGGTPPPLVATLADGQLVVEATRKEPIVSHWSLAGREEAEGVRSFLFALPDCAVNRLQLDLPIHFALESDTGLVRASTLSAGDSAENEGKAEAQTPMAENWRRWTVELGGNSQARIRVMPAGLPVEARRRVAYRQRSIYEFSEGGIQVSCDFEFQALQQPVDALIVRLGPAMRLASASLGQVSLRWVEQDPGPDGTTQISLALPVAWPVGNASVTLAARVPLARDVDWRLPQISLPDADLVGEELSLRVPQQIELQYLEMDGYRQTGLEPFAKPRLGESLQLQAVHGGGSVRLRLVEATAPARLESGLAVALAPTQAAALWTGDFSREEGEQFELRGRWPPGWSLERVSSVPEGRVDDWQLDAESSMLHVRLRDALRPAAPLRLLILARRETTLASVELAAADLRLAEWQGVTSPPAIVAIDTDALSQLSVSGDADLERVTPEMLTANEKSRLGTENHALVFRADRHAQALRLSVTAGEPPLSADIRVDATVGADSLSESTTIRCTPGGAGVSRLLVAFFPARPGAVEWSVAGMDAQKMDVRRIVSPAAHEEASDAMAEPWEVVLREPQQAPFVLEARVVTPGWKYGAVALATVLNAGQQTGQVVVHTERGASLTIDASDSLLPQRLPASDPQQAVSERASYGYDPMREVREQPGSATLAVGPAPNQSVTPRLWAQQCRGRSRFTETGEVHHTLQMQIETLGAEQASLHLPGNARHVCAFVEGEAVELDGGSVVRGHCNIPLPADRRLLNLELRYVTSGRPLSWWTALSVDVPRMDFPLLDRGWFFQLPDRFQFEPNSDVFARLDSPNSAKATTPLPRVLGDRIVAQAVCWTSAPTLHCRVYRTDVTRLWGGCTLLGIWGIGCRWGRITLSRLVGLAGAVAAVGWLVPAPCVPFVLGGLAGLVLSRVTVEILHWNATPSLPHPTAMHEVLAEKTTRALVVATFAGGVILGLPVALHAASAEDRVLIPVDSQQQPVGNFVFVPRSWQTPLNRWARAEAVDSTAWKILAARYEGDLQLIDQNATLNPRTWTAVLQVRTMRPAVDMVLPWLPGSAHLVEPGVRLNGEPCRASWDPTGHSLRIHMPADGDHQVELHLQPVVHRELHGQRIELALPRVVQTELRLRLPTGAPSVKVRDDQHGTWSLTPSPDRPIRLGPTTRMSLSWATRAPRGVEDASLPQPRLETTADANARPLPLASVTAANPSIEGDDHVAFLADMDITEIQWRAHLTVRGDGTYQIPWRVPGDWQVIEAKLSVGEFAGRPIPITRWSRNREGAMVFFLASAWQGEGRFEVRARMPSPMAAPRPLSSVGLPGVVLRQRSLSVHRRPSVAVALAGQAEAIGARADQALPSGHLFLESEIPWGERTRLVADYRNVVHSEIPALTMRVAPQPVNAEATMQTRLFPHEDGWRLRATLFYDITSGVVDQLRFELPAAWTGKFRIDGFQGTVQGVSMSGQGRNRWIVWPTQPLEGTGQLSLETDLRTAENQAIEVPQLVSRDVAVREHWLIVPTRLVPGGRPVSWDWQGLEPTSLPAMVGGDEDSLEAFHVPLPGEPQILKGIRREGEPHATAVGSMRVMEDGSYAGTMTWDLVPANRTRFSMELPHDCQLVHVRLDGIPANPVWMRGSQWQFDVGRTAMPRRLEVVYTSGKNVIGTDVERPPTPTLLDVTTAEVRCDVQRARARSLSVPNWGWAPATWAGLTVVVSAVGALFLSRPLPVEWMLRWLHVGGVLLGLATVVLGNADLLGWGIVMLSLMLGWRFR